MPFGKTINVLADETVIPVDVSMVSGILPGGKRRLEGHLAELRRWLDETPRL